MKIISVRRGLQADHSSATYEFFALQRLTPEQRERVRALTRREPRGRRLSFHYPGERTLPSEWDDVLLTSGYEVLISEDYDWWRGEVSLPYQEDLFQRLAAFECESDANGVDVRRVGEHMIASFGFQMDYEAAHRLLGEDPFPGLGDLFERVREELLAGNVAVPHAFCELYGDADQVAQAEEERGSSEVADTLERLIVRY